MELTLFNTINQKEVTVEDTKVRVILTVVALEMFYGSLPDGFDTNFITKCYEAKTGNSNHESFTSWFANVLWLIMIVEQDISHSSCYVHHTVRCVECCRKPECKHLFA